MGYRSEVLIAGQGPAEVVDRVWGEWRAAHPGFDEDDLPRRRADEEGATVLLWWYSPAVKWYTAAATGGLWAIPEVTALEDLHARLAEAAEDCVELDVAFVRIGEDADDIAEEWSNGGFEIGCARRYISLDSDLFDEG